ncbi:Serine kinase [Boothiomyces sp. JEL0838]|nr:Serine kinase [Boothiomyces sp. JEL0838]
MNIQIKQKIKDHASEDVIVHCLYGYFYQGVTKAELSRLYGKSPSTITNWINKYKQGKSLGRQNSKRDKKISDEHEKWILDYFIQYPTNFLRECQFEFNNYFDDITVSTSSIWHILNSNGFSYKVVERRAFQIKSEEICRFTLELNSIDWTQSNLLFLDEVSFDSRGMIRKRGYGLKGKSLQFRGEYIRKPRVSCLSFLACDGIVDTFQVEGK